MATIKGNAEGTVYKSRTGQQNELPPWRRDLFSTILANTDDGVSVQDRQMRIIYANKAHKRLFGENLEGRFCFEVYERRPRLCPDCPVDMAYKTGKPYRTTHHGYDKHGHEIAAEIVATPVFDEDGEIVAGIEVVRIVTEQLKSQGELLKKSQRLERLAAVSREISSGLDLNTTLRRIAENAAALTGADAGTVALLDEKKGEISYPYHFNMPARLSKVVVPAGEGIAGYVMKTGEPLVLDDYPSHPSQVPAFTEAGVISIMGVPLMVGDHALGALGLFGKSPSKKFNQDDLEMALAVADQAAIAIENANLFRDTQERLRVTRELHQVAISITSGLDLGHVLSEVARHAAEMAETDAAMIALLDQANDIITYPYAYNLPPELCQLKGRPGVGAAGDVIIKGKPRIDNDYPSSKLRQEDFVRAGVTAVATVPLMIADRCVGAIGVMDKGSGRKFTTGDLEILSIVSRQAAVAVENARLYEELSRSAQKLEFRVKERTEALSRMYHESERKSKELEVANYKLREVDRMKSEFLANMSHELRTPLNSIIGFSKLILDGLDGDVNEEQQKDLNIIHDNGQVLLRLIDDLLNLAKIEAGRMNLILDETSPADLVKEAVMSMQTLAGEKKVALDYQVPDECQTVRLDAGKVRQVLFNLISNAIKFTDEGRIVVAIEQSQDETTFSVNDTGIGVGPEHHDAIFDRFHQVSPGLAGTAGVGLGLTISKRFVEMHKGRIWVESEPGIGSTFFFSIPRDL